MSDEAVLFANDAFYQVFRDRDPEAMEALWARAAPVACLHPGWGPLYGREAVLESFAAIMDNPDNPPVVPREPKAHLYGDVAFVTCYEVIEDRIFIATNVFVREESQWRMVHHQSGPCAETPETEAEEEPPPALH